MTDREKEKLSRPMLQLLTQHSEWSEENLKKVLHKEIYPRPVKLLVLFRYLLLSAGVAFLLSGVVFFFAYNWDELSSTQKFLTVEIALVILVGIFLLRKKHDLIAQLFLIAAVIFTGVLFAIFGQVYQSGANAYDFFLSWTASVVLWVIAARMASLWLIFLVLINTTLLLYFFQVREPGEEVLAYDAVFLFNFCFLIFYEWIFSKWKMFAGQSWFPRIIQLGAVVSITIGVGISVFKNNWYMPNELAFVFFIAGYIAGFIYYYKSRKDIFPLALIGFSSIIIMSCVIIESGIDEGTILLLSLLILLSTSGLAALLYQIHKSWKTYGK